MDFKKSENKTSRDSNNGLLEVSNVDANYNNINYTNFNQNNPIHQSCEAARSLLC